MAKSKVQRIEKPGNAFSRMNYLYQAAQLISIIHDSQSNPLSNYYNKIMKEISKKVVEKLHPDLKRTVCCSCNYPLTAETNQVNVKIKTSRKKKKKNHNSRKDTNQALKFKAYNVSVSKYLKNRIEARNKNPNKIWWTCSKCEFSKGFLQRPSYKLWIHEIQNNV